MKSPFAHKGSAGHPPLPNIPSIASKDILLNPTDEVDALMGNTPSWILRTGITLIAAAVAIFLFLAWLIKYPDIELAKVVLTTENPPIRVVALSNGKISHFFIKNGDKVEKEQVLAVLENAARWQDVLTLEKSLDEAKMSGTPPLSIELNDTLQLGSLQQMYAQLCQNWRDFSYFNTQNGFRPKIDNLKQQIQNIRKLKKSLQKQLLTLTNEVEISRNELKRQQQLYAAGQLSASDLEKFSANVLQMSRQLEALRTTDINYSIQEKQLESQILDLSQSKKDNSNAKMLNISADIEKLLGEIQQWKRIYLLTAPIAGQVAMTKVWSLQQYVNANDEVLTIVPENKMTHSDYQSAVMGKAFLPIAGAGKVKVGQAVQIRLDGFPYQEFGQLEGVVKDISLVPQQDNYYVEIELKSMDLKTTYGKKIPFRQETQGIARIITDDRRILSRIFEKVTTLFKNS